MKKEKEETEEEEQAKDEESEDGEEGREAPKHWASCRQCSQRTGSVTRFKSATAGVQFHRRAQVSRPHGCRHSHCYTIRSLPNTDLEIPEFDM